MRHRESDRKTSKEADRQRQEKKRQAKIRQTEKNISGITTFNHDINIVRSRIQGKKL